MVVETMGVGGEGAASLTVVVSAAATAMGG